MRVVMALPDRDFDPSEAVVPWRALREAGVEVLFATARGPRGPAPRADPWILGHPLLRALGLTARPEVREGYRALERDAAFNAPVAWADIDARAADGLLLPGGHWRRGMRQYLEGRELQAKVVELWRAGATVGAICHGPVVLARATDPATGRSLLHGRRVTALRRDLELSAWLLTGLALGDYYRTYATPVEAEVRRVGARFDPGPRPDLFYKTGDEGWALTDDRLVTARWPGDATTFARAFLAALPMSAGARPHVRCRRRRDGPPW
jgi:putative intracellular protease/amidase